MNTNDQHYHQCAHTMSISMEDLGNNSFSISGSTNLVCLTPPLSPRKHVLECSQHVHPKSKPIPISLLHQRSHSDTLCSVPDAVESLLSSCSSDYWSKLRERMEQDKEQEQVVSLVEEIHEKYNSLKRRFFFKLSSPTHKHYLPGMRSASGELQLLVLNSRDICTAGNLDELSQLVCNLRELDLANNALGDWKEIYSMLSRMPHLVHCNLSQNPLNRDLPVELPSLTMTKMKSLILNATGIPWSALFPLLTAMPNLEELHLSLNDYSNRSFLPSESAPSFPAIHILHVNNCRLNGWEKLKRICRLFPCLEALVAAQNPLVSLGEEERIEEELSEVLACIHCLNCNNWEITCWTQIELFTHLPLLTELRVSKVPLFNPYSVEERRYLVIARLPDVSVLNGSNVTREQRMEAERFFLRHYAASEKKPNRYGELERIHGALDPLPVIDLSPKDTADVKIVFEEKEEMRGIDLNETVGQLKKSLESFCGLPSRKFKLYYRDMDNDALGMFGEEELRFPKKLLWVLKVRDGDEFHIEAKSSPPPRGRTSNSAASGTGSADQNKKNCL